MRLAAKRRWVRRVDLRQKVLGAGIALVLVSFAAVGAFAAQDAVTTELVPTETPTTEATATAAETTEPTATSTTEPTETSTPEATETATPEATETPTAEATETPAATATAEATETTEPEEGQRDIKGIPSSNPSHDDGNGDDVCDKGETVIKTTPSGVQVRVPCQAAGHGNGNKGEPTPEATESAVEN